jgi:glycosyltransferase involved in cell wall biosynthesis
MKDDRVRQQFVAPAPVATLQRAVDEAVRFTADPLSRKASLKVSVVIPSYNQAEFLGRTLNSLLNQTYGPLEIIVVDGGSTDGTVELLRAYEQHLAHWISEPDRGQSDALNKGFELATGDIFGWLNADDLYLPDAVAVAVEVLTRHPNVDVAFGDHLEIDTQDRVINYFYDFPASTGQLLYEGFFANAQAMFWRRSLHLSAGHFDVDLHRTMDYEMMVRFLLVSGAQGFEHVNRPLGCFRRHDGQKTQGFDEVQEREHRRIAARHCVNKYGFVGRCMRIAYRGRRAYWYWRRGGLRLVAYRLRGQHS